MANDVSYYHRGPMVPDRRAGLVWLTSYPKSGNTWFRTVLAALVAGGDKFDINDLNHAHSELITASRVLFHHWTGLHAADLPMSLVRRLRTDIHVTVNAQATGVRVMKVHDAWPAQAPGDDTMFPDHATIGTIYLVRNPLDVAISLAAHMSVTPAESVRFLCNANLVFGKGTAEDGIQPMIRQHMGDWSHHVSGWLAAPLSRLMVLRYEDMLAEPQRAFEAALGFAGFTFSAAAIAAALEATRFDRMQRMEAEHGFNERPPGMSRFFRSGRSGGWRESLTPADVRLMVDHHEQIMRRFGYLDENVMDFAARG